MSEPFHPGEIAIQEVTGERQAAELNGRVIQSSVPPPAVPFVAQQRMAILSREDASGQLWAGLVFGPAGFATVSDDRRGLTLAPEGAAAMIEGGPLARMEPGDLIGGLFLETATRRRLRVNGMVDEVDGTRLRIDIAEAYPACPKYIQRRAMDVAPEATGEDVSGIETGTELTDDLRAWIEGADTLFVASGPRGQRLDVSHRGGEPGFVRLVDGGSMSVRLRVPDYPGNSMFNTLGNFHTDPRAGIVFPDFATGRQLSLTGTATLHVEGPADGDPNGPTGGTDRWWDFAPEAWVVATPAVPRRWSEAESSPFNPDPGPLGEAA